MKDVKKYANYDLFDKDFSVLGQIISKK